MDGWQSNMNRWLSAAHRYWAAAMLSAIFFNNLPNTRKVEEMKPVRFHFGPFHLTLLLLLAHTY